MKGKVLEYISAKGKNKRFIIILYGWDGQKDKSFRLITKTLVDFKTRNILETDTLWSVESFVLLRDLFSLILDNPEVKNRLILKEIKKMQKFQVSTSLITK